MTVAPLGSQPLAVARPSAVELPSPWSETSVSVVVPTYNEAENLPKLAERIFALPLPNLRLIVVDDSSPDGTGEIADRMAEQVNAEHPDRMIVVHRTTKDGIGRAYIAGMTEALNRDDSYIIQMDADLSHPPEFIPEMLGTALSTEAGLIIGSRYIASGSITENWGLYRRMLSRGGSLYVNSILKLRIQDTTGGFKLWRRDLLKAIDLGQVQSDGFSFQIEMNVRAKQSGFKIIEVPIHFDERYSGSSKITLGIQLEGLLVPVKMRLSRKKS